jgi:hypothetical protein
MQEALCMATHEIAREDWNTFLTEFSRRHQDAKVAIETVSPVDADGVDEEADFLPFLGITLDTKGNGTDSIKIATTTEEGDDFTHVVTAPKQVYHKTGAGVLSDEVTPDEILEITSANAPPITYLRFRHPGEELPPVNDATLIVV